MPGDPCNYLAGEGDPGSANVKQEGSTRVLGYLLPRKNSGFFGPLISPRLYVALIF